MEGINSSYRPASFYTVSVPASRHGDNPTTVYASSPGYAPVNGTTSKKKRKQRWAWSGLFRRHRHRSDGSTSGDEVAEHVQLRCQPRHGRAAADWVAVQCRGNTSADSTGHGSERRQGKRQEVKARVEARRSQVYSSDEDLEGQHLSPSTPVVMRSCRSEGNLSRENSLRRRSRIARTERYLRRRSREDCSLQWEHPGEYATIPSPNSFVHRWEATVVCRQAVSCRPPDLLETNGTWSSTSRIVTPNQLNPHQPILAPPRLLINGHPTYQGQNVRSNGTNGNCDKGNVQKSFSAGNSRFVTDYYQQQKAPEIPLRSSNQTQNQLVSSLSEGHNRSEKPVMHQQPRSQCTTQASSYYSQENQTMFRSELPRETVTTLDYGLRVSSPRGRQMYAPTPRIHMETARAHPYSPPRSGIPPRRMWLTPDVHRSSRTTSPPQPPPRKPLRLISGDPLPGAYTTSALLSGSDQSIARYKSQLYDSRRAFSSPLNGNGPVLAVTTADCADGRSTRSRYTSQDSAFMSDSQLGRNSRNLQSPAVTNANDAAGSTVSSLSELSAPRSQNTSFSCHDSDSVLGRSKSTDSASVPLVPPAPPTRADSVSVPLVPPAPPTRAQTASAPTAPPPRAQTASVPPNTSQARSKQLELALRELETLYQELCVQLDDEELMDRAERRDLPTEHQLMWRALVTNGATRDAGQGDTENQIFRTPTSRRSVLLNKTEDDLYWRRIRHKADDCQKQRLMPQDIISKGGSYLLMSPVLSPTISVDGVRRSAAPSPGEPDIAHDDVTYMSNRRANAIRIIEPQPAFGIPLAPTSPAPVLDYLHMEPSPEAANRRSTFRPRRLPDLVLDDVAYRALRRDCRRELSPLSPRWQQPSAALVSAATSYPHIGQTVTNVKGDLRNADEGFVRMRGEILNSSRQPSGRPSVLCVCGEHMVSDGELEAPPVLPITPKRSPAASHLRHSLRRSQRPLTTHGGALYELFVRGAFSEPDEPVKAIIDTDSSSGRSGLRRTRSTHDRPFYQAFSRVDNGHNGTDETLDGFEFRLQISPALSTAEKNGSSPWNVTPYNDLLPSRWQAPTSVETSPPANTAEQTVTWCATAVLSSSASSPNLSHETVLSSIKQKDALPSKVRFCSGSGINGSALSAPSVCTANGASTVFSLSHRPANNSCNSAQSNNMILKSSTSENVRFNQACQQSQEHSSSFDKNLASPDSGPNGYSRFPAFSEDPKWRETSTVDHQRQDRLLPASANSLNRHQSGNSPPTRPENISGAHQRRDPRFEGFRTTTDPVATNTGLRRFGTRSADRAGCSEEKGELLSRLWLFGTVLMCTLQLLGLGVLPAACVILAVLAVAISLIL